MMVMENFSEKGRRKDLVGDLNFLENLNSVIMFINEDSF